MATPRRTTILSALCRWLDDWDNSLALAFGIIAALCAFIEFGETITR